MKKQQPVLPLVAPVKIMPPPTPTQIDVGGGTAPDGTELVVVQIATPQGVSILFFTADAARHFAAELQRQAGAAAAGIVLVQP